ncbi:MAG: DmsC/YnfH family molybdoenzyme membrane anchor subunit [Myxococcota bacterium]
MKDFIDAELAAQQDLSAVQRFARLADTEAFAPGARHRDRIPLTRPRPGEQYAFEVDLDACSGCKSCVTACHNLNGLDAGESWRAVGELQGGSTAAPYLQSVTTACHHCVEPACMTGCPALAYEKDPATGIVRHLDDQCIGCQYCVFMCPYEVPRFSHELGIVRKCDMCHDRLAADEAPACVQACPTAAISITLTTEAAVVADSEAGAFLPGAPDPRLTFPSTRYVSQRPQPANALPADYFAARPERAHPPLVAMLVLTQLSVGTFAVEELLRALTPASASASAAAAAFRATVALVLGLAAIGVSVLHLGRPLLAWKAVLGLRRSWLSREIMAFGAFAGLALLHATALALGDRLGLPESPALGALVVATGALGVYASVMVYAATRRACWHPLPTALRFFSTAAILGLATSLVLSHIAAWLLPGASASAGPALATALAVTSALKLAWEASLLRHVRDRQHGPRRRTATLLLGELHRVTGARFLCGFAGGVALPSLYAAVHDGPAVGPAFLTVVAVATVALCLIAELAERHLFFVAASAPAMPGGLP